MCEIRSRPLARRSSFCYLTCTEGGVERVWRPRPDRLAQSPRRLQPLAASAVPADDGVQGTSAHRTPFGVLDLHTPRIPDAGGAIRTLGMHFRVQAPLWPPSSCWTERMSHRYTPSILPLAMQRYACPTPIHDRHTPIIIASTPVTAIVSSPCTPEYRSLRRHPGPGIPERAPYCACP